MYLKYMTENEAKQYCQLIADETNVQNVGFEIGMTEKGKIELEYQTGNKEFRFLLEGVDITTDRLRLTIPRIMEGIFSKTP